MIKALLKRILPERIRRALRRIQLEILKVKYRHFGRPPRPAETSKARARRLREGFFERFCQGRGLDVGHGGDPVTPDCQGFDVEDGDAQRLSGLPDAAFDFVYSSHTIEHMRDPAEALRNWWRVLRPGGHLILYLPHRDLYEKKRTLPSRWNSDHKHFFLLDEDDPPDTLGIVPLIHRTLSGFDLIYAKECAEGHTITDPLVHSDGEYSIEVVLRKRP